MKITFEELLSEKTWLHKEMLTSLSFDLIDKASEDGFYDVKLLINGVEMEPKIFNDIVNGIERYVDAEAEQLLNEKLENIKYKINLLDELFSSASEKIKDEFNLI